MIPCSEHYISSNRPHWSYRECQKDVSPEFDFTIKYLSLKAILWYLLEETGYVAILNINMTSRQGNPILTSNETDCTQTVLKSIQHKT